jgi:hypothetical protein
MYHFKEAKSIMMKKDTKKRKTNGFSAEGEEAPELFLISKVWVNLRRLENLTGPRGYKRRGERKTKQPENSYHFKGQEHNDGKGDKKKR